MTKTTNNKLNAIPKRSTLEEIRNAITHNSSVKRLFRRFDYSSIYLLIGATYTPILLCILKELLGWFFSLSNGVLLLQELLL